MYDKTDRKWHCNSQGEVHRCHASLRPCPLGLSFEDHYASREEALEHFEKHMNKVHPPYSTKKGFLHFEESEGIPLQEMDKYQLEDILTKNAIESRMDEGKVSNAIEIAEIAHRGQKRKKNNSQRNTPYIEHPLRNALRIIKWGCKDQDIVIAAVLHDTIEDGSKKFCRKKLGLTVDDELEARSLLSERIRVLCGSKVESLVLAVTNDYRPKGDTTTFDERNKKYLSHIYKAIHDNPDVFLVKVSDFVDNASSLVYTDVPGREVFAKRRAVKYYPVVKVFQEELTAMSNDLDVSTEAMNHLYLHLGKTGKDLKNIIEKHKDIELH